MNSKVHASTSITLRAYRVLPGSLCHTYYSQNPTSSRKVQVTLPLSFCHVLKCPKVIELDIPWRTLVVAYLFSELEIQMINCNGQWKVEGTVAEISIHVLNRTLHASCTKVVLNRYYNSTVHNGSSCLRGLCSQRV